MKNLEEASQALESCQNETCPNTVVEDMVVEVAMTDCITIIYQDWC